MLQREMLEVWSLQEIVHFYLAFSIAFCHAFCVAFIPQVNDKGAALLHAGGRC